MLKELTQNKSKNCNVVLDELNHLFLPKRTIRPVAYETRKYPCNYTSEYLGWILERGKDYWVIRTGLNPLPSIVANTLNFVYDDNRSPSGMDRYLYRIYDLKDLKYLLSVIEDITMARKDYRIMYLQMHRVEIIEELLVKADKENQPITFGKYNKNILFSIDEIRSALEIAKKYDRT